MWASMPSWTALTAMERRFLYPLPAWSSPVVCGPPVNWGPGSRRPRGDAGEDEQPRRSEPGPPQPGNRSWPNRPVALAKSHTWRGLTTTTGRDSAAQAATKGSSSPPEAQPKAAGLNRCSSAGWASLPWSIQVLALPPRWRRRNWSRSRAELRAESGRWPRKAGSRAVPGP